VGDAGTIARFDGSNWTLVDPPTTGAQLWAVAGDGPAAIHAVGAGGTALFYDGSAWAEVDSGAPATTPPGTTMFLFDVTTTGVDGAAVAVGTLGTIVRRQGGAWSLISSPLRPQLDAVWLADPQHGVAAGSGGTAMHLDGSQWTPRDTGISVNLHGVWGASMTHIFAVGEGGAVVHLDPTGWAAMLPKPTTLPLRAVWGASASEIFAVSESLEYYVCDGTSWTTESFGVPVDQLALNGLWGIGQRRFAVGAGGTILAYDGTAWSEHQSHVRSTLYAVWDRGPSAVFAVGAAGAITDYDGTVWTMRMDNDTTRNTTPHWRGLLMEHPDGARLFEDANFDSVIELTDADELPLIPALEEIRSRDE